MNTKIRKHPLYLVSFLVLFLISGLIWLVHPGTTEYEDISMKPSASIVQNIERSPQTQSFANFLASTDLSEVLNSEGPYTVFVPTEQAYSNIPSNTLENLFTTERQGVLRQILLYHIVKGHYEMSDLRDGMTLTTIQGENLTFTKNGEYWIINGYSYLQTPDVIATNGVIHIVTNYLLPESLIQK